MVEQNEISTEVQNDNIENNMFRKENISNLIVKIDTLFGLRAIGVIFFGSLASYLALVGILDIKIEQFDNLSSPLAIFLVSILPISLTFMLIRNLHKEWYLTTDFLNFRSGYTTLMILFLSILVSETLGVIQNKYTFDINNIWNWDECKKPLIESFLTAILSLVLTSTFVLTSFARNVNVPGLPSNEYTKLMRVLHKKMKEMKRNDIWNNCNSLDNNSINLIKKIEEKMDDILDLQGDYFAKISIVTIREDVKILRELLITMERKTPESKKYIWKLFFEDSAKLDEKMKSERTNEENLKLFESVERLRGLKL